ncbi:hypothetical protein QJS10_CPA03g00714 [Acorus calamus]|uniref:Transposase MuDR plant domain-containing protein n=1 Tax=Acorus calamus TaxID=4465 RepID=A0AAV9F601_ACOCL|nr:hypothetical protein QJS10_CPA03g00714 [Acorus calamus]
MSETTTATTRVSRARTFMFSKIVVSVERLRTDEVIKAETLIKTIITTETEAIIIETAVTAATHMHNFCYISNLPIEPSNEKYVLWGSLPNVDQLSEDDGDDIQIGEDFSGKSQYHEELEGGKESSDEELGGEENTHEEELEYGQNEPTVHEEMEYSGTDSDVSVGDYGGIVLHYDPELPIMEVGSQFPNVEEFRNSLRQHCILHEFGVKYIKNDKFKVTAKCQGVDCPWRIHASVIQDNVTFEVKTLMRMNDVWEEEVQSGKQ